VFGHAQVRDDALVFGRAEISGRVRVLGSAEVSGDPRLDGETVVCEEEKPKRSCPRRPRRGRGGPLAEASGAASIHNATSAVTIEASG
jgi:hypothetical protein